MADSIHTPDAGQFLEIYHTRPSLENGDAPYLRARHVDPERIRGVLDYDPVTGILRWKERGEHSQEWNSHWSADRWNRTFAGKEAGSRRAGIYIVIKIDGHILPAHVVAYVIMTGDYPGFQLDHEDRCPFNNRWHNLRTATHSQQQCNRSTPKNNTIGVKGVKKETDCDRYRARIQVNGKRVSLGLFKTLEEAQAAYREANQRLHGKWGFAG